MAEKMHYLRAVEGRAMARFGSGTFIGCVRTKTGHRWNTDAVVVITETEYKPHRKAYRRAIKTGDVLSSSKKEYDEYISTRRAKAEEVRASAKAIFDEAAKETADTRDTVAPQQ